MSSDDAASPPPSRGSAPGAPHHRPAPSNPSPGPQAVITTFLIVRHAESEANAGAYFASQSDSPLSARGRAQAAALCAAMEGVHVHAIYSSDLSRARETVLPLATARGLTVIETPRLRERAMGELTGVTFDEAKKRFPELWRKMLLRDPYAAPAGGESHAALFERVAGVVDEMHEKHRGEAVLIASHGVAIHHMLRHLIGIRDVEQPLWTAVDNASVSRVDVYERETGRLSPRLVYANRLAPLAGQPHF